MNPKVRAGAKFAAERFAVHGQFHVLRTNIRMVVVHKAVHTKFVARINADAAVAVRKLQRLQHAQILALAPQSSGPVRASMSINGFDDPSRIGSSSASSSTYTLSIPQE